jgi:hypothetical protein
MNTLREFAGLFLWILGAALFFLVFVAHSTARLQWIVQHRDFSLISSSIPSALLIAACFIGGWLLARHR